MDKDFKALLEDIIDREGLGNVIEALAEIARDKAEHVLVNWQDKSLARSWEHDGRLLGNLYGKICN